MPSIIPCTGRPTVAKIKIEGFKSWFSTFELVGTRAGFATNLKRFAIAAFTRQLLPIKLANFAAASDSSQCAVVKPERPITQREHRSLVMGDKKQRPVGAKRIEKPHTLLLKAGVPDP